MRKTLLITASIMLTLGLLAYEGTRNFARSSYGGADPGYCGSPAEYFASCVTCHGGSTPISLTGVITSNIPSQGYSPGSTYTITATISRPGHTYFGFEISPQNSGGNLLGTIVNTSVSTQIVGSGKYITHTGSGVNGNGPSKTWTFDWIAPTQGSGNVTFYGAFLAANKNYASSGDTTFTSSLTIQEGTLGINSSKQVVSKTTIYPNPASDKINIDYAVAQTAPVKITLVDLLGKTVEVLLNETKATGIYSSSFNLKENVKSGVYFIIINMKENTSVQKVMIQ